MRAILRFKTIVLTGALWFAPLPAAAQNTTEPVATNTPAPETIGPRELQNFSLPGTAQRPSEPPPAAGTAPQPTGEPAPVETTRSTPTVPRIATVRLAAREPAPVQAATQTAKVAASTATPPPVAYPSFNAPAASLSSPATPEPRASTPGLSGNRSLSILPWLLAAAVLAGATFFLLWRRRSREAYAAPHFDLFAPSEPAPMPAPAPPPRVERAPQPAKKPASAKSGLVTARLRPSIEIGVQPLRCIFDDDRVAIEFEIELFNNGTAPARAVLAEASLLNASATQEEELAAFFTNPVGGDQRIDSIPPMKRVAMTSRVFVPRSSIQEYVIGGRTAFVPVLAFNTLYRWSGGEGQTSAAYLVGRETGGDKLGPLRLDPRARDVRGLGSRALPTSLRT